MKQKEWIKVIKTEKINKYFLIGLVVSVLLHMSVFAVLISIERKKEKEEEKPIYVYLSEFKEEKKKAPQSEKKIPKKSEKPKPKPKVKKKVVKKPVKKPEKKVVKKKIRKEVIKPVKKPEKIVEKEPEKIEKKALPDIVYQEDELLEEIDQIVFEEDIPEFSPKEEEVLDLSKLEGKEEIFQPGKEEKVEEEVSDEDILAYIKELEMYLNNLARKRDLYPPLAKRLRIEGSLIIRFTILSDGSVDNDSIKIISSSGYNVLDKGARKLIEKYVPEFARKYGKKPPKGDLTIELPVTFEIIGW
ncbi:MAG TPA: energy transducer TonB [Persephonella sp.]|uniref:energy transducer TonB n=1 Tax=Persephonella marina TaxID=309805 RepID=UPI0006747D56|nr:energy transducer TonB [Persephonella marina]HCB70171.1 energy transducer TonB [Persephonella sp.]